MIAEAIGKQEELLDVAISPLKASDLSIQLLTKYPKLQNISFIIAVNQTIVSENTTVNESDEIALLPPFAGG